MWESGGRKGKESSERADCAGKKGPRALWEKGILNPSNKSVFPRQNLSFKLWGCERCGIFLSSAGREPASVILGDSAQVWGCFFLN